MAWAEDGATFPVSKLPNRDDEGKAVPHPTFANFGLKRGSDFPALVQKHGVEAFLRDPKAVALTNTQEALDALQAHMVEMYHKKHSATVVGDTLGAWRGRGEGGLGWGLLGGGSPFFLHVLGLQPAPCS